jgi:hypothetical protein
LVDFLLLPEKLHLLAFRKAQNRNDEEAELYVTDHGQRNAVVALRPESLADTPCLDAFLRHEFSHLQDMVDPGFEYTPEFKPGPCGSTPQRLTRDRYRLLWDISIDGRLTASEYTTMTSRDHYRTALARGFSFWPNDRQDQVFDSLWNNPHPRHADLAALAADPRDLGAHPAPTPGAPCPLCGFPTFAWVQPGHFTEEIIRLIRIEFAAWAPEHGACARCHECYQAAIANLGLVSIS